MIAKIKIPGKDPFFNLFVILTIENSFVDFLNFALVLFRHYLDIVFAIIMATFDCIFQKQG